jgi:predicted esterase
MPGGRLARESLEHELGRLEGLLGARRLLCNPEPEIDRLEGDLRRAAAGESFLGRPGAHRLAYRSQLDGRLHAFVLYVPAQTAGRLPLVVMLHGMNTDPMRDIGRLFGVADSDLRDPHITCDRPRLSGVRAFVVAPGGFGDTLYRVAGEAEVTTVVELVLRSFPVDRRRVTITGLSMGGTGAIEIAMQHPGTYAGVLALCGYYDRRQDSSVQGEPLLPWEKHMMTVHSPLDWAVNGQGIPLRLVHGEQDGPARATRMHERYRQLGYPVELELFPRGHDVWVPGYEGGRAFPWLLARRKQASPRTVSFATGRPRVARAYWVRIDRFADHTRWARVKAAVTSAERLQASTENVAALHFDLPAALARTGRLELRVDDSDLELVRRAGRPAGVDLIRSASGWQLGAAAVRGESGPTKRTGLSGPLEDIYYEPLVVVYGTGRGRAGRLRAVAEQLARYRQRVTLRYPVMPDRQFGKAMARRSSAILVGTEQDNSVLARMGPRLPIRVLGSEVVAGERRYRGPHLGATFIYPNPEAPRRYIRVVAGSDERAYRLHEMLPTYQPDYLIFDEGIAGKKLKPVLGAGRGLLAGGYFDESWQLGTPPLEVRASPATVPAFPR